MTDKNNKLYYTISEVSEVTGIKAHVLRYWEREFPSLHPRKARSGARRYRQRDIDEILAIKRLLYDEGFRIAGARKIRRQELAAPKEKSGSAAPQLAMPFNKLDASTQIVRIRDEVTELLSLIRELNPETKAESPAAADDLKQAEAES
ncbi:MAG: MerR family transcriptional regulator [bacterium]